MSVSNFPLPSPLFPVSYSLISLSLPSFEFSFSFLTSGGSSKFPFKFEPPEDFIQPNWRSETENNSSPIPVDLFRLSIELLFLLEFSPLVDFSDRSKLLARAIFTKTFLSSNKFPFVYECSISFKIPTMAYNFSHSFSSEFLPTRQDRTAWGRADFIFEAPVDWPNSNFNFGVYLLQISPKNQIKPHFHRSLIESELILDDGIICQRRRLDHGESRRWNEISHCYKNPSENQTRTILCIDAPIFDRKDEIELSESDAEEYLKDPPRGEEKNFNEILRNSNEMKFSFPGAFPGQRCEIRTFSPTINFPENFEISRPDAVLLFAFNRENQLILVQHRHRGWELIGGKLEVDESPISAICRESMEEAAVEIDKNSIRLIGQYKIFDSNESEKLVDSSNSHTKSVYFARVNRIESTNELKFETKSRRFQDPPVWSEILSSAEYSQLLKDNVYPICLKIVQQIIKLESEK